MEVRKVETDQDPGGHREGGEQRCRLGGFLGEEDPFPVGGKGRGGWAGKEVATDISGGRTEADGDKAKNLTPDLCKERGKVGISNSVSNTHSI